MKTNLLALLCVMVIAVGCGTSSKTDTTNDSRFVQYISSHTRGMISKNDIISVSFTENTTIPTDLDMNKLFTFTPNVSGSVVKTGEASYIFSSEKLKSGQSYEVSIDMTQLMDMPSGLETYKFQLTVIQQDYEIEIGEIQIPEPTKPDNIAFEGRISTADQADNDAVEKMITFPKNLEVTWQHPSATSHRFVVNGVKKKAAPHTLKLAVSGAPIDVKKSQDVQVNIPSSEGFVVMSSKVTLEDRPYVSIFFTDALDESQDLTGLYKIEGVSNIRPVISGNQIKLYVSQRISGSKKLEIYEGIKNTKGDVLTQNYNAYVAFEPEKPQIKLEGSGNILPSTSGLVLPFEAVNLKAVQVDIFKVFADNIPQFLQVNSLKGKSQLDRVGRLVVSKDIDLSTKAEDLASWNRFTLDLSTLFESERGALYQVRLSFRPEQSNYPCDEVPKSNPRDRLDDSWSIYDNDNFPEYDEYSYYYDYDYRYPYGYKWEERDNPCHISYYLSERFHSKSLLATDLGLIAKIGGNNTMKVYTTNMVNAQPVSANITILDYQLTVLASAQTDVNGMVSFEPSRRPFLVVAESEGQRSYLKLEDNQALSMSNFDVTGTRIRGNVKGYIYGERGVWRPGDDIYLSMLLQDPEDKIPADHPVVMELTNPRGIVKDKQVLTSNEHGLYVVKTSTATDDVTGNWQAEFQVGSNTFSKTIKVETIKPNRLKIDLKFPAENITPELSQSKITLDAKWLTGLKAKSLKAETEVILSETKTTFKGYDQYDFDNERKSFHKDPVKVFSGELNADGQAQIESQLPEKPNSPGAIQAIYNTKVFEPGGGFSINTKRIKYYPYTSFVGMNLTTSENGYRISRDKPQKIEYVTLDANGKPVNRDRLIFKLYKLSWSWWWEDRYNRANYTSSKYNHEVISKEVSTSNGRGSVEFTVQKPDWGRYLAVIEDPVSGHSTSHVYYTSWYGSSGENSLGASSLQVSTDKMEYATYEKVQVTVRGTMEGQALISVENGSEVLQNFWIKTNKEWTTFELDATPDMAPNVYLHITLLQPHGQTINDLPIRLYGVAPIGVYDPETKLQPEVQMVKKLEPESSVKITVSESNGKPMAYTVAMVDEGLLDLTNFKTPNPWEHFYSKEAIGVKTWDIYNDVIGAYGGRLERLLAIGGGYDGEDAESKKDDNRFKPVVQFAGPFYLDAGQQKTHTLQLPQYIGSVRTMVVAGLGEAYGHAEKTTPVVKPLMVLGTMPRVVGPGEKVSMPVNVFKYDQNLKTAKVTVETSGVLQLKGQTTKNVELTEDNMTLYFDLEVEKVVGTGKVNISVTSAGETARHEINMTSRSPNSPQRKVKVMPLEAGKTISPQADLFGMPGTNEVSLEVATIPPINLEGRMKYLIRYPHGCVEQTISSVFPQLFLDFITELSAEQKVSIDVNIATAIKRLTKFQTSSGGLGYWPGHTNYNSWGTSYAYHFLVEAQKQGYSVPVNMMNRIRDFQRSKARNWVKSEDYWDSDIIQAYRLFTLAIAGHPEVGAMNRLRNTSNINKQSIHKLAAAYAAIGQHEAARELMKGNGRTTMQKRNYTYYYYNYGSFTRDLALLLETHIYMNNKSEAFEVIQELSKELSDERWMSTQTTAYSLLAVSKYVQANNSNKKLEVKISYDGNSTRWSSAKAINRMTIPEKSASSLKVTNEGESTLFATLTVIGTPAPGDEPVQSESLSASVRYLTDTNRSFVPDTIKMGETFDIEVSIRNEYQHGYVRDLALTHILPSGWEIQNDRLTDQESTNRNSTFDFQDIRDDRIYTYFDLNSEDVKTYRTTVTATYPGMYYLPGVHVEAMYNASISAKRPGKWVYVVK